MAGQLLHRHVVVVAVFFVVVVAAAAVASEVCVDAVVADDDLRDVLGAGERLGVGGIDQNLTRMQRRLFDVSLELRKNGIV